MAGTLLCGTVVTADRKGRVIPHGAVRVEDGKIAEVGRLEDVRRSGGADRSMGGERSIVIPGLINTHNHSPMVLFKGVLEGMTGMRWLETAWAIEANLTPGDVLAGARLACVEMLRSGTTCFADHYFKMDQVAAAVEETGIRGALAEAILEFGDESKGEDLAREGRRFARRWKRSGSGRVTALMGPHSTYTCTPRTLKLVKDYAVDLRVPIHIHLSEHREEPARVRRKWGKRPVELLESIGFLGDDVLGAHVTFVTDRELGLLARRRVNVNNNVYCKMKGGQGVARAREMLDRGINVSLGTDGPASHNNLDMFEEMKFAIAAQALKYRRPDALSAAEAISMATMNGARALHLDRHVGSLEPGKDADVVVLDASSARGTPFYNPETLVAQTLCGRDVADVLVKGRQVVAGGRTTEADEDRIMAGAEESFRSLMGRSGVKLADA
jgi:5-methylthioadenosine/S-adenosylhomocysteine deaminase